MIKYKIKTFKHIASIDAFEQKHLKFNGSYIVFLPKL